MQVQQIANNIFAKSGFEQAKFELQVQFHYLSEVSSLIARAGKQKAVIHVVDDRPRTFYYNAKPYAFTKDSYIYSEAEHLSDLLSKTCVESHPISDGSTLYLFNIN